MGGPPEDPQSLKFSPVRSLIYRHRKLSVHLIFAFVHLSKN